MNRKQCLCFSAVFFFLFALTACATTTVKNIWKDQTYQGQPINKILVIGVVQRPDFRNLLEEEFAKQLNARGTDAIPIHTILQSDKVADKAAVAAKSKELGADAVLITRMLDTKSTQTLVPTGSTYVSCDYYTSYTYYASSCGYFQPTGYTVRDQTASLETDLYEAKTDKLIWSAQSEMWMVESAPQLIKSFVKIMVDRLSHDKLTK